MRATYDAERVNAFIKSNLVLRGRKKEFSYAVRAISSSFHARVRVFGIVGEPLIGKRAFCHELECYFRSAGMSCAFCDTGDPLTFTGDIVFVADTDRRPECPDELYARFSASGCFVVYTSCCIIGDGDYIRLHDYSDEDVLSIIGERTGFRDMVEESVRRTGVGLPTSPIVLDACCREMLSSDVIDNVTMDSILEPDYRRSAAMDLVPFAEARYWADRIPRDEGGHDWELAAFGSNYTGKEPLPKLRENNIVHREGQGYTFSEGMCVLAKRMVQVEGGDPDELLRESLERSRRVFIGEKVYPPSFVSSQIALSRMILDPDMYVSAGLDLVARYLMDMIRFRVFDKDKPMSIVYLEGITDRLGRLKQMFVEAGKGFVEALKKDSRALPSLTQVYGQLTEEDCGELAMEITATMPSQVLETFVRCGTVDDTWVARITGRLNKAVSVAEGSIPSEAVRTIVDSVHDTFLSEIPEWKLDEDKRCTIIAAEHVCELKDNRMRWTPWVLVNWVEYEVNSRRYNLESSYGFRNTLRLKRYLERSHQYTRIYPLDVLKPLNEDLDYSSAMMFSETLDPALFDIARGTDDDLYERHYGTKDFRSVAYMHRVKCRQMWESNEDWDRVCIEWQKAMGYAVCHEDELMTANLYTDIFHYFRLYCEIDKDAMSSKEHGMEVMYADMRSDRYFNHAAEVSLDMCSAELFLGNTVKANHYFEQADMFSREKAFNPDSLLYRTLRLDTEAHMDQHRHRHVQAIRKMEELAEVCARNGLRTRLLLTKARLLCIYLQRAGGMTNRSVSAEDLREDLESFVNRMESRGRRDFTTVRTILEMYLPEYGVNVRKDAGVEVDGCQRDHIDTDIRKEEPIGR